MAWIGRSSPKSANLLTAELWQWLNHPEDSECPFPRYTVLILLRVSCCFHHTVVNEALTTSLTVQSSSSSTVSLTASLSLALACFANSASSQGSRSASLPLFCKKGVLSISTRESAAKLRNSKSSQIVFNYLNKCSLIRRSYHGLVYTFECFIMVKPSLIHRLCTQK